MSEKKVFVILGSKNDELTAKLLKSFENCSINYILIDFEKLNIFYSLTKNFISIRYNFSIQNLLNHIKKVDKKINFKRDCIFLFEFQSSFNKSELEYTLSTYVRKKKYQRFFYNRRSFSLVYFITDDFYGINKKFLNQNKKNDVNKKVILSKISNVRNYKLKFDPLMEAISEKDYFMRNIKQNLKIIFYIFRYFHYFLILIMKKFSKKKPSKKIFFITPKQKNFFLVKTKSKFSNLSNLIPIIIFLSFYYELTICIHPKNQNSWLNTLLKLLGIKTVTSVYGKEARNLIENSKIILTIGTTSVVEALLSSKPTLEIGKTPRVAYFQKGYNFLSEDKMTLYKIKSSIEKISNLKHKVKFQVPNFCSVFYPSFVDKKLSSFAKNTGTRSIVSNLEINYLKDFFLKKFNIKNNKKFKLNKR